MNKFKLAILISHPIQHQAPLFQRLAQHSEIDLMVYFCWDFGFGKESYDRDMGRKLKWDIPLTEGYRFKFLKNFSLKPDGDFLGQINFGIIKELMLRTSDVHNINGNFRTSNVQKLKKYDAILIFGWNSFTNWLAFLTAFIFKIPVLLRGENPLNQELLKPKWKIAIKKIYLKWLFDRISAFLYFGEENKKFYQHYGVPSSKLFFCPYADDNERYIAAAKSFKSRKIQFKNELGISSEKTVILFVGKFISKKRPFDLLKAYESIVTRELVTSKQGGNKLKSSLVTSYSKVALLFVGDGPLRSELEKYAETRELKNVHFVGFKNLTELPKYYALSDILVLPSGTGETWGLVVNIAMCFGLPVIISDVVGCGPDLVRNGINGYVFPLSDIEKLAQQIEDLAKSPQKREKFGRKGFEIVQSYTFEKDVEAILAALKR